MGLISDLYEQLTEYMGMRYTFSIVDKHANGCECIIEEIVQHLRALVYDNSERNERRDVLEDPSWIPTIQYIINTEVSSETGYPCLLTSMPSQAKDVFYLILTPD